eukprot:194763_1
MECDDLLNIFYITDWKDRKKILKAAETHFESENKLRAINEKKEENEFKQPQKPTMNKIVHVDNKMTIGGINFSERLAMFKHMTDTKGGKPEILRESQAYTLVNKWKKKKKKKNI